MSAILETPSRYSPPPFDPDEPFGGIGMLRRFTVAEYHRLIDLGFFESEPDEWSFNEGYIVHKWRGDPEKEFGGTIAQRRFTVYEYHEMIRRGILEECEHVELLDGYLVLTMPHGTAHDSPSDSLEGLLLQFLPLQFFLRIQKSITLEESEPEPDIAVVLGPRTRYRTAHPKPADISMIVEVANSSLRTDRREKSRIYAQAGIPAYWILNVVDLQIETFAKPDNGVYEETAIYRIGSHAPVVLDGVEYGAIAVSELLPEV